MRPITHVPFVLFFFAVTGCSAERPGGEAADATRMQTIVRLACDKAGDPSQRDLLKLGKAFVDIEDLEVPCVGVSIPIDETGAHVHLSFTRDWFHGHTNSEIATALLEDLSRVLSETGKD
jgi:hypothetical protein